MSDDSILVSREGALARVTFNRPASLNAMDFEMGAAVAGCRARAHGRRLRRSDHPGCRGPRVLRRRRRHRDGDVAGVRGGRHRPRPTSSTTASARSSQSDKPIVAAVQGAVAGGGLGLMLTADYIVASESAKFVSKYANIGLTPDLGVSTLLPAAIGQRRALQLLLQDTAIDAATALDWGLVTEVVPRGRGRRARRGGRPVLARQRHRRVRPGQAAGPDRRGPARSRRTSPTRRPRSAPASTPTNPAPGSRRSPRHPPSPPAHPDDAPVLSPSAHVVRGSNGCFRREHGLSPPTKGSDHDRPLDRTDAARRQDDPHVGRQPRHRPRDRPARRARRRQHRAARQDRHPASQARGHGAHGGASRSGMPAAGRSRSSATCATTTTSRAPSSRRRASSAASTSSSTTRASSTCRGSLDLAAKKYDLMQDVNVRGTFLLSRAAVPILSDAPTRTSCRSRRR